MLTKKQYALSNLRATNQTHKVMNLFYKVFLSALCALTLGSAFGTTSRYRLSLRDNPATSIVIGWDQLSGSNPTVHYGTSDQGTNYTAYPSSKSPDRSVSYKGMSNQFVRLTGLQPNTAYYFVIHDSQGTSQRFWFKTAPDNPNERLSFIAGGDSRNNRTPRRNANTLVAKLRPHAVMFGGDMTNGDSNSEWLEWFDDWQNTIASDGRMFPIVAARGNHEGSNNSIYNLFDVPSSNVYYAITFGGNLVRSYTLNSEISISGSQTSWLSSDLQNSDNVVWKMAQYHKPMRPHVSSKSEGTSQYSNWANLFYDHNVRLVVECDAHTVKTTWPVQPTTGSGNDEGFVREDNNGTVYVGEGCWGAPLRSNNDAKSWTRASGQFNQFKWIFVDQDKIECRTIKVDNASQVGSVSDSDIFTAPSNLDIWNPSSGSVVTIQNTGGNLAPTVDITSPATGSSFSSGQVVTIQANATDTDGSVSSVQFLVDGVVTSTDYSAPFATTLNLADGAHQITARATDNEGATSTDVINISVGAFSQTVESRISSSMDDVEENSSGGIYTNSSDIELVADGSKGNQTIGLRFGNLNIPQGATITNAYVQFTTDETNSGTTNLTIRAHDSDNASAFTTSSNNVSNRSKTSASVAWSPSAWSSVGQAGSNQRTPELKNVIQEVVSRSGFGTNSHIVLIITGTGERTAEAYDGTSSSAPLLHVEYSVGGGATSNQAPSVSLTSPSNGSTVEINNAVTISANASDSDGTISSVSFYSNGSLVGTDNSSPYSISWTPSNTGSFSLTAIATDNDGATTTSSARSITVEDNSAVSASIDIRVSTGSDDAEEGESGAMYLNSSDLELVYDSYNSQGDQTVGIRFQGLNIPQGATITNAYIQFTTDETGSTGTNVTIRAQDVNDAGTFTSSSFNISNRATTSASANWQPATWNSLGQAGTNQRTPNLSALVQEVVNRGGWTSGNDMAFIITGSGKRTAESYNGSSSSAPLLHVEYTTSNLKLAFDDSNDEEALTIYPNPAQDFLFLETSEEAVSFQILSGAGDILIEENLDGISTQRQVYLGELPQGIYFVVVNGPQGKTTKKFIKQ